MVYKSWRIEDSYLNNSQFNVKVILLLYVWRLHTTTTTTADCSGFRKYTQQRREALGIVERWGTLVVESVSRVHAALTSTLSHEWPCARMRGPEPCYHFEGGLTDPSYQDKLPDPPQPSARLAGLMARRRSRKTSHKVCRKRKHVTLVTVNNNLICDNDNLYKVRQIFNIL